VINKNFDQENKKMQQEAINTKIEELIKLKEFLNFKIFSDFEKNPTYILFLEKKHKKKELEQAIFEKNQQLTKIRENFMIKKNIHSATLKAKDEKKNMKEIQTVDLMENQAKYQIKNLLQKQEKISEKLGKILSFLYHYISIILYFSI